ncbi:MAG: cobalamin-dependent protein [Proteobacteria bacterium]|nr:cobalamin-dependent protein [Pseudomonadota bacterium]
MERKIRIILAKPGLDGHLRGINVLSHALRDAGMEVIYLGVDLDPREIGRAAVDEGVDVIGLSIHAGGPVTLVGRVQEALRDLGAEDIPIVVGGIISKKERQTLKEMGVRGIFGPGSDISGIVKAIRDSAALPAGTS